MAALSCPTRNDLEAFSRADISEVQFTEISEHLANCPNCEGIVARFEQPVLAAGRPDPELIALVEERECQEAVETVRGLMSEETLKSGTQSPFLRAPGGVVSLPGFHIIRQLGYGGMGHVYQADDIKLGRQVAIKFLMPDALDHLGPRFQREMSSLAQLDHPNVVRAYQAGESENGPFLVMEYLDGIDVGKLCRSVGQFSVSDACEIARQAALGLQALHERNLVHRDIKPHNLMLDRDSNVKIVDFGLARGRSDAVLEMTATGDVLGSAEYVAPEQVRDGRQVDIRTDIYSLGCTLFRMLAGSPPFDRASYDSVLKMIRAHEEAPVPQIRDRRIDVPRELAKVIATMLAKQPDERYDTPAAVFTALSPFVQGADLVKLVDKLSDSQELNSNPVIYGNVGNAPNSTHLALERESVSTALFLASQPTKRRPLRFALIGAGLVGMVFLAAQILLHIRHSDGTVNSYDIPAGSEVTVSPSGTVEVKISGKQISATSDTLPVFERIIDDGDRGYSEKGDNWSTGSLIGGYGGDYRVQHKGSLAVRWTFENLKPGTYEVYLTWVTGPLRGELTFTTLFDGGEAIKTTTVNMIKEPNDEAAHGVQWKRLGIYSIESNELAVEIDGIRSHGVVIADAVRIVRVEVSDKQLTKQQPLKEISR